MLTARMDEAWPRGDEYANDRGATIALGHSSAAAPAACATDAARVRAAAIARAQAGRRSELGLLHELWRGTFLAG